MKAGASWYIARVESVGPEVEEGEEEVEEGLDGSGGRVQLLSGELCTLVRQLSDVEAAKRWEYLVEYEARFPHPLGYALLLVGDL